MCFKNFRLSREGCAFFLVSFYFLLFVSLQGWVHESSRTFLPSWKWNAQENRWALATTCWPWRCIRLKIIRSWRRQTSRLTSACRHTCSPRAYSTTATPEGRVSEFSFRTCKRKKFAITGAPLPSSLSGGQSRKRGTWMQNVTVSSEECDLLGLITNLAEVQVGWLILPFTGS